MRGSTEVQNSSPEVKGPRRSSTNPAKFAPKPRHSRSQKGSVTDSVVVSEGDQDCSTTKGKISIRNPTILRVLQMQEQDNPEVYMV